MTVAFNSRKSVFRSPRNANTVPSSRKAGIQGSLFASLGACKTPTVSLRFLAETEDRRYGLGTLCFSRPVVLHHSYPASPGRLAESIVDRRKRHRLAHGEVKVRGIVTGNAKLTRKREDV